ncbi:MAG: putative toxin-antitoxin system toxin component, PIN family [Candidatus Hydrogenedentota bacterium]
MKIVLDTNVLIASLITHGTCFEVIEHCIRNHRIVTSNYIIKELEEKLIEKFYYTAKETKEIISVVLEKITNIGEIKDIIVNGIKDKDDYKIIGTAIAGNCDCIITGDQELISLKKYKNIDIILPKEFWAYEIKLLKRKQEK